MVYGNRGRGGRRGGQKVGRAPITAGGGRGRGVGVHEVGLGGITKQGRGGFGQQQGRGPARGGRGGRGGGSFRGGRARGRGGRGRGPSYNKNDLDAELDSYFLKDKDVGAKHLDSELDNYFKNRDAGKKDSGKPAQPATGGTDAAGGGPAPMQS